MSGERRDLNELHPTVRAKVADVLADLQKAQLPFDVFEAYRLPSRQRKLFRQGGVTKADAWESYHQYGMAVDLVLKENGGWSWRTDGGRLAMWDRMNAIGRAHGLKPLSWEKPHLQLDDVDLDDLQAGRYPPGGDDTWARAISDAIESWPQGAPPAPLLDQERPRLPELLLTTPSTTSLSSSAAPVIAPVLVQGISGANFERAQGVIKAFEGGFVQDPKDPGGATNFGITHRTLAAWRGVPTVTPAQVAALTYDEAKDIFFAKYWSPLQCGAMPGPLALAVYNAGIHCGIGTSARFLQSALNAQGAGLVVDGDVGPITLAAVARSDIAAAVASVIALYEARLQSHPQVAHFGKGFANRVATLRAESGRWLQEWIFAGGVQVAATGIGQPAPTPAPRVQSMPTVVTTTMTTPAATDERLARIEAALKTLDPVGGLLALGTAQTEQDRIKVIRSIADRLVTAAPELAPVNNALGTTIGGLFSGKKSLIGIIGSIATALFAQGSHDSVFGKVAAAVTSSAPILQGATGPLLPIFLGMTVWGLLGRQEKWGLANTLAATAKPSP
jgi:peptidoglycan LD-endopeptidase CwlK